MTITTSVPTLCRIAARTGHAGRNPRQSVAGQHDVGRREVDVRLRLQPSVEALLARAAAMRAAYRSGNVDMALEIARREADANRCAQGAAPAPQHRPPIPLDFA
ncbi:hypothetical protein [Burkholderia anthina]|uniref:hypothetical protein n=1 Tax=Burkholderia anthina TaxID=179879 RepID=UPI00158E2011|nr:hypothetical protein [Burkholderia anthina]